MVLSAAWFIRCTFKKHMNSIDSLGATLRRNKDVFFSLKTSTFIRPLNPGIAR